MTRRGTWHIKDHVPLLRRLRWGEIPYANLRYRNGPDNRLPWKCRGQTDDEAFLKFDCNWVGNWLRPGSMPPRKERDITPMNKDEWIDSLEVNEVSDGPQHHITWLHVVCHRSAMQGTTERRNDRLFTLSACCLFARTLLHVWRQYCWAALAPIKPPGTVYIQLLASRTMRSLTPLSCSQRWQQ